ncbi:MAG: DNA-processing protein DprA [Actinobacteria bacterium]|nr:DNA-processing protein DprA [Actinomycetota bacterium]
MSALDYWLCICQVPALYSRAGGLAGKLGGADAVWLATRAELRAVGCSEQAADEIVKGRRGIRPDAVVEKLEKTGARVVSFDAKVATGARGGVGNEGARAARVGRNEGATAVGNRSADIGGSATSGESTDRYPESLAEVAAPPQLLFIRGRPLDQLIGGIAVVGSRRATAYGKSMAESLGREIVMAGLPVVSGLARGIDASAHQGALESEAGTVAVLGCGVDIVYPPENKRLMSSIAEAGWILSEYPPGTAPLAAHFPARNRIIAGLSMAVVVVEAAEKSGALITADCALDQGKEVFAVPGSVRSPQSKGTHKLLKQGAALIESAEDLLEYLGIPNRSMRSGVETDEREQEILDRLGWEPVHLDDIVRASGDMSEVANTLLLLELKGLVNKDHGGFYIRVR